MSISARPEGGGLGVAQRFGSVGVANIPSVMEAGRAGRAEVASAGPRRRAQLGNVNIVASCMATETIAAALHLSQKTVQNYHYGIKAKLGARNDAHLVWLAIGAGVVTPQTFHDEP